MTIMTYLLLCLCMTSEEAIPTQNLSLSIIALEADADTIQVALEVTGQKPQAIVMQDAEHKLDLYIAATEHIDKHMNGSGFENALHYDKIPGDELAGTLSFHLAKDEIPETLEISVADKNGQSFRFRLKGLLDNLGTPTVFGPGKPTDANFAGIYSKSRPACCPAFYKGGYFFRSDCEINYIVCAYSSPFGFAEYLCAPGTCYQ